MRSSPLAVTAVIAAAGSGERLGAGGPKAFVPVAGRPMVEWSIEAFRGCRSVEAIVVAVPPGHVHDLSGSDTGGDELRVVPGGATRAQSVASALAAVGTELVAIHDAARPLLTAALVEELVAALAANPEATGAIPAAPVTDTIKEARGPGGTSPASTPYEGANAGLVVGATLDRSRLWAAQTPQVFRAGALRAALALEAPGAATDEAMLVEAAGGTVLIHESSPQNLKVTTAHDLRVAELLLGERGTGRSGSTPLSP
jgi:2-C-methyl-D-erythritol 4-phosphate cytidylyltransferase